MRHARLLECCRRSKPAGRATVDSVSCKHGAHQPCTTARRFNSPWQLAPPACRAMPACFPVQEGLVTKHTVDVVEPLKPPFHDITKYAAATARAPAPAPAPAPSPAPAPATSTAALKQLNKHAHCDNKTRHANRAWLDCLHTGSYGCPFVLVVVLIFLPL